SGALPPLVLEDRVDGRADPLALEPGGVDVVRLAAHADPLHDPDRRRVTGVALREDRLQPQLLEAEPQQLARGLGGVAPALGVWMQRPADLALAALSAEQAQDALADEAPG